VGLLSIELCVFTILMDTSFCKPVLFLVVHFLYSEFSVFTILMHASVCEFQLDEHVEGHV
jgi:hypothetical protein